MAAKGRRRRGAGGEAVGRKGGSMRGGAEEQSREEGWVGAEGEEVGGGIYTAASTSCGRPAACVSPRSSMHAAGQADPSAHGPA